MKWLMLPATVALAGGVSGVADAKPATPAHARAYERVYRQVAHKLGHRAPGRDIVRYGTGDHRHPTDRQTLSSLGVLQRMLAPANDTNTSTPSAAASGAGTGGLPACASESGSDYSTGPTTPTPRRARPAATRSCRRRRPLTAATWVPRRPGRLRRDHLPAPGRERLGRLRRLETRSRHRGASPPPSLRRRERLGGGDHPGRGHEPGGGTCLLAVAVGGQQLLGARQHAVDPLQRRSRPHPDRDRGTPPAPWPRTAARARSQAADPTPRAAANDIST